MLNDKDILFYPHHESPYPTHPYARILKRRWDNSYELQHFKTPEDAALRNNPCDYPHYVSNTFLNEYFQRVGGVDAHQNGPVPEDYNNLTIRASEISKYPGIVFRFPFEVDGKEGDPAIYGYAYLAADPRQNTHVIARTTDAHGWHCRNKEATAAICHNFIGEQVYSWPRMSTRTHTLVMGGYDVEE